MPTCFTLGFVEYMREDFVDNATCTDEYGDRAPDRQREWFTSAMEIARPELSERIEVLYKAWVAKVRAVNPRLDLETELTLQNVEGIEVFAQACPLIFEAHWEAGEHLFYGTPDEILRDYPHIIEDYQDETGLAAFTQAW